MSNDYGYYYRGKNKSYYYDYYSGDFFYYDVYPDGHEQDKPQYVEFKVDMAFDAFIIKCKELENKNTQSGGQKNV